MRDPRQNDSAENPAAAQPTDGTCNRSTPWQVIVSRLVAERGVDQTLGLKFGDGARDTYDLYEPPAGTPVRGLVQFIYGGSWETGERGCYSFVGAALAKKGLRTVIADYRLFPETAFPGFVHDAARAYAHAFAHHAVDGAPPVIVGHSAGAHIAALLCGDPHYLDAAAPDAPRPQTFVGLSGPYAFDPTTWETTKRIFTAVADTPDIARPIMFARPSFPRSLLMHGGRDTLVTPNASTQFHDALTAAGAHCELHIFPHLAHVGPIATFARPLRWRASTLRRVVQFITNTAAQPARDAAAVVPAATVAHGSMKPENDLATGAPARS
ncbi:MAG: alpha/beta hydrolase [Pseudomonadota bacterium]